MNPPLHSMPAGAPAAITPATAGGESAPVRRPLGEILIERGLIDEAQLNQALREGAETGERLGEVIVRHRWATEDDVARALAEQWGLSYVERSSIWFDADALTRLSREDAQRLKALPTRVEGDRVVVAVAEPTEQRLAALEALIGDTVLVVVPKTALETGLHSDLLSSRKAPEEHPPEDVSPPGSAAAPAVPLSVPREAPAPAAVPAPAAASTPAAAGGLQDVAALAEQARGLADLMAAQAAAVTNELAAREGRLGTEELTTAQRRVAELEAELAERRVAAQELKRHLEAALRVLERDA